jgi:SHS2 domain-containing protein
MGDLIMIRDFVITMISSVAVSSVIASLLIWLTKSWISERLKNAIKNEYDEKLETHKSQLRAQNDVEIEKLKSSLSITAAEQSVKFSTLHKVRAEVIANTYALLKDVYLTTHDYVSIIELAGCKPREERKKIALTAHKNLRDYYQKRLIYLPASVESKLEDIHKDLTETFNIFQLTVDSKPGSGDVDSWHTLHSNVNGEIQDALKDLEKEFRRLLGDKA